MKHVFSALDSDEHERSVLEHVAQSERPAESPVYARSQREIERDREEREKYISSTARTKMKKEACSKPKKKKKTLSV
jgi:hypothetical protein